MTRIPGSLRVLPALALLSTLAACGGSGDDGPPRLAAASPAALVGSCAELATRIATLADTTVTASNSIPAGSLTVAGQPVREHCQLTGQMFRRTSAVDNNNYAIGFEMRLPRDWNGRFLHQGNGGIDGSVVTATGATGGGPLTHALHQGFAVLSSDAGHTAAMGPNFGIDPQARLDYGYQAVAKLTPMAKSVIQAAYSKRPDRSYFAGCSNGGRHAMIAATRYATDYDGIIAGAPGYNLPKAALASIAGGQLYASVASAPATATATVDLSTGFTTAERRTVGAAVLARCDALDGATDGIVQDVEACRTAFDLQRDVPTCTGARDGSCLTTAQKGVVAKIFAGPTLSNGSRIYASFPYDPGVAGAGIPFWEFTAPLQLDSGAVGLIFKVPPNSATGFNGPAFTLGANLDLLASQITATNTLYTESAMSFMTPPNPTDMGALKNRGGKILVYHGVADPIFSVDDSEAWYKGLQAANGGDASNFARFFRVPGMGHCSGGPATDQFDALSAMVNWVEQGVAPDTLLATARGAGNAGGVNADLPTNWSAGRTRPLCPYPKVARYNGTGDIELASSFSCR
jgi:pimeloyl-ACP methyl ester carboxylesterase